MKSDHTEQWREKSFAELFDIRIGGTPSRSKPQYWAAQGQEGAPWASIADLRQAVVYSTKERITLEGVAHSNVKLLPVGTVMMSFKLTLGRVAVAGVPLYTNEAIAGLVPKSDGVLPEYVAHCLPYVNIGHELDTAVKGQTLNKEKLGRLTLRYPSPTAQNRVVAVLNDSDTAIRAGREIVEGLEEFKRRFIKSIIDSAAWRVVPLETVAVIQTGVAKGKKNHDSSVLEVPYLRVANVQDGYFNLDEVKTIQIRARELDRYALRRGDVLLTEGGDADKLGRGQMWDGQIEPCVHQNHIFAVRVDLDVLNPKFLAYLIGSEYGKRYFAGAAKQSTNLASINSTQLKAFPCMLPSLEEQGEIVEVLSAFDERIRIERERGRQLEVVKQGLAQQLLTGKLTVPADREAVTG